MMYTVDLNVNKLTKRDLIKIILLFYERVFQS